MPMDIEDSSVPYRAFLRSGAYPALGQRVVRSGGVLVRAAGWCALVAGAASAGYNTTQRLVTPSAAEPSQPARAASTALAGDLALAPPAQEPQFVQELVEREPSADTALSVYRPSVPAPAVPNARKRAGAVGHQPAQPAASAHNARAVEELPSLSEASRAEQIAERVRALDGAAPAPEARKTAVESDPIEAVLREHLASATLNEHAQPQVLAKTPVAAPRNPYSARASEPKVAASLPLSATAKIDGLAVRGPLSVAHVRRSVERVRPTLSDCYTDAAQRAGHNRFAPLRVQVTIDEAGRVKMLPKVEGAQLPGLGECVGSALSKLVCQAPDTGTARASITVSFVPEARY